MDTAKFYARYTATAPMEENIAKWNASKRAKYLAELEPNSAEGWTLYYVSLEVGALGWIPPSFMHVTRQQPQWRRILRNGTQVNGPNIWRSWSQIWPKVGRYIMFHWRLGLSDGYRQVLCTLHGNSPNGGEYCEMERK